MASIISAGNATNGLAISSDNTGILQLKTGTGAGTTAVTVDASQNTTFAGTAAVPTGTLYPIVSGTAVSASGTAVDFTGVPSWVKRITVVFNEVSTNGASVILVQIGAGTTPETTGYISTSSGGGTTSSTTGYCIRNTAAASVLSGLMTIVSLGGGVWIASHTTKVATTDAPSGAGSKTITGTLGVVRITTTNGTDTFDAGSINILYE